MTERGQWANDYVATPSLWAAVSAYLTTHTSMPTPMRFILYTWPCFYESFVLVAFVHINLCRQHAIGITDVAVDTVICDIIARPKGVCIICKWPICNATVTSSAIAAKA